MAVLTRVLRIQWALTGQTSFAVSIAAIELILKCNNVQEIYSLEAPGQYIPLIVGIASLVSVCWNLVRQESVRLLLFIEGAMD
jgi:hypothetical protein